MLELHPLVDGTHLALLTLVSLYGVHRLTLLARFRWEDVDDAAERAASDQLRTTPFVTVQLPVYNERGVAERLIRSAGELRWPRDRFEVQVLDDSSDSTRAICEEEVARLVELGIAAVHVRREDRAGFKAGALANGLETARGELVCLFDADFLPQADFLERVVPRFTDPALGMVQARWGHVNRDESLLTRAQATLLDGRFVIEHKVRCDSGLFFNFNGTAGVWRRAAIEDAGGWQSDTLTEDLDLSYRAQLAGWRFAYAHQVVVPAEVPADLAAFQSQQQRWAQGGMQVLRKLARPILSSRERSGVKLEALVHLTANVGYPCVLGLAATMPLAARSPTTRSAWFVIAALVACTLSVLLFYERAQRQLGAPFARRVVDTLAATALGIGMSVGQTRAVLAGLRPQRGAFVRTPKRGDAQEAPYRSEPGGWPVLELALALWMALGAADAVRRTDGASLPFFLLFLTGFGWVGGLSLAGRFGGRATEQRPEPRPARRAGRSPEPVRHAPLDAKSPTLAE